MYLVLVILRSGYHIVRCVISFSFSTLTAIFTRTSLFVEGVRQEITKLKRHPLLLTEDVRQAVQTEHSFYEGRLTKSYYTSLY